MLGPLVLLLTVGGNLGAQTTPTSQSAARDDETARSLLEQAKKRFAAAEFEESVDLLGRAQRATKSPKLLGGIHLQLGIVHDVLGGADRRNHRRDHADAPGRAPSHDKRR